LSTQPWFHGSIARQEAEALIDATGSQPGIFLVRSRSDGTYALSQRATRSIKHHILAFNDAGLVTLNAKLLTPSATTIQEAVEVLADFPQGAVSVALTDFPARE
jgi:phage-related tail fiber protein